MVCIGLVVSGIVTYDSTLQTHHHIRVVSVIFTTVDIFEQSTGNNRLTLETRGASKLNLIELEVRKTGTGDAGRDATKSHIDHFCIQTNRLK